MKKGSWILVLLSVVIMYVSWGISYVKYPSTGLYYPVLIIPILLLGIFYILENISTVKFSPPETMLMAGVILCLAIAWVVLTNFYWQTSTGYAYVYSKDGQVTVIHQKPEMVAAPSADEQMQMINNRVSSIKVYDATENCFLDIHPRLLLNSNLSTVVDDSALRQDRDDTYGRLRDAAINGESIGVQMISELKAVTGKYYNVEIEEYEFSCPPPPKGQ